MQKAIEKIIEEAEEKFGLPREVIVAVFESPYKCAREKIAEAKENKEFVKSSRSLGSRQYHAIGMDVAKTKINAGRSLLIRL